MVKPKMFPRPDDEAMLLLPLSRKSLPIIKDVLMKHILPFLIPEEVERTGKVSRSHRDTVKEYCSTVFPKREFQGTELFSKLKADDFLWYHRLLAHLGKHYMYMTRTDAKNVFRVTDTQCKAIPNSISKNKTYFGNSSPMILLPVKELFKACIDRHKNVKGLADYRQTLLARKLKREEKCLKFKIDRPKQMQKALEDQGLTLRDDSRLCREWIAGSSEIARTWTLEAVVRRCCEVRFLFDYCAPFQVAIKKAERQENQRLRVHANR